MYFGRSYIVGFTVFGFFDTCKHVESGSFDILVLNSVHEKGVPILSNCSVEDNELFSEEKSGLNRVLEKVSRSWPFPGFRTRLRRAEFCFICLEIGSRFSCKCQRNRVKTLRRLIVSQLAWKRLFSVKMCFCSEWNPKTRCNRANQSRPSLKCCLFQNEIWDFCCRKLGVLESAVVNSHRKANITLHSQIQTKNKTNYEWWNDRTWPEGRD